MTEDGAAASVPPAHPEFVCPRCHGTLNGTAERYHCARCRTDYPVLLGIPDFRLEPDPWIGLVEDREKGLHVEEASAGGSFEDAVRAYWAMTPGTPRALAERFTRYVLGGEQRAAEWLDSLAPDARGPHGTLWLELGCGTGDLVAAARERGVHVAGIDVAFRWLVIARRRAALAGQAGVQLVCCNAEHLPFPGGSFGRVAGLGVLEHCRDAARAIDEAARVLRPDGVVLLRTVNRYTLLREPHVQVWGVGFVPRRWADAYVRARSSQRYLHHRPLSARELGRLLRRSGFTRVRVAPARLLPSDLAQLPRPLGALAGAYDRAARLPLAGAALRTVVPLLEARASRS